MSALLEYLQENFYTRRELLAGSKVDLSHFLAWQHAACMPLPSYRLDVRIDCLSFFGEHEEVQQLEFYAKGYVTWLDFLATLAPSEFLPQQAYAAFRQRYQARTLELFEEGIQPLKFGGQAGRIDPDALDEHIASEWASFLKGTYGLCTRSGLPEDIAGKEMATLVIDEITDRQRKAKLGEDEAAVLLKAVRQLDQASSQFAPHERARSSRERCIRGTVAKYQLVL